MGSSKPVVKFTFSIALVAIFNVHLKMRSGGNRNEIFSSLTRSENDENVDVDFDDAREIPIRAFPKNLNSSNDLVL